MFASSKILPVIVPSYNMEKYLPKCLGSLVVAPELMERLEVLVVNDGSKDRTSEIAHEFAAKWPNTFKVIDKANGHYGSCINAALRKVTGRYIKILDADDYVVTEEFYGCLRDLADEDSDLVISDFTPVDPDGRIIFTKTYPLPGRENLVIEDVGPGIRSLSVHSIIYKRTVFEGWNYRQLEGISYTDCQWVSEPMLRVRTVKYWPGVVTCYLFGREGQSVSPDCRIRSIDQQIKVDLYLAGIHASGKPEWSAQGAWDYFERLLYSELREIYAMSMFGYRGKASRLLTGKQFDQCLKEVDVEAWSVMPTRDKVNVTIAGILKFNIVKLARTRFAYWVIGWILQKYSILLYRFGTAGCRCS